MTENQKLKKYLSIYKKNPQSKVFVLLSEIYRNKGDKEEALRLCQKGVEFHPKLSAGHIAKALVLLDMGKWERASNALEKAIKFSPENILAYKLLGQCYLKLKQPLKTLSTYKMLLFLDPKNKKAQNVVKKLEPITATQYDETGFAFKSLKEIAQHLKQQKAENKAKNLLSLYPLQPKEDKQFKARLSVIEALIYKKDFKKAKQFISEMKNLYPKHTKVLKKWERLLPPSPLIDTHSNLETKSKTPLLFNTDFTHSKSQLRQKKIQKLNHWLSRLEKGDRL